MRPTFYALLLLLLLPLAGWAQSPTLTTNAFRITSFCAGSQVAVGFQASNGFSPNNVYTAELSDASGSFRAAVAIGVLAGNATGGTINATLPATTASGTGYRIRVVASRPAVQGINNGANLTITNLSGATASSNSPVCPGSTLQLTATAPRGATFAWTGPNNFSSTLASPTIAKATAAQAGTYSVKISLNGCSETRTVTVSLLPAENAAFSYFAPIYCQDPFTTAKATLANGATAGVFTATPAGLSLNSATGTVDVNASTPGTYTITNTTQGRCPATATQKLTIKPAAILTVTPDQTICAGSSVKLTASGADTYVWLYDNQNVVNSSITVKPTQTTTYTVTGTTIGACNTVTKKITVTVVPIAKADFSYPILACQGSGTANVTLAAGATAGTFSATPAGLVLNAATGEVDLAQSKAGTYTVTNDVRSNCPATATAKLTIQAPPVLVVTADQTVCAGTSVKLTASGADAYAWKYDNQTVVNSTITVTPTKTTTYTVTGTRLGCSSASKTVTITVNPVAKANFSYPILTCQGSGTAKVTLAAGATAGTFSATPTGLVLNAATGEVDLVQSKAGTYTVTNTISSNCPATATATLAIQAPPVLVVTGGDQTVCAGTSVKLTASGADAYSWKYDNQTVVNNSITVTPTKTTTYTVTGTRLGCTSVSKTVTITLGVCTATRSAALNEALQVYPNPGNGNFTISLQQAVRQPVQLRVLNMLGQVVWEGQAAAHAGELRYALHLQQQPAGIYLLHLTADGNQTTRRLLICR